MCGARFGQALAFLGGFRWLDAVRLYAIYQQSVTFILPKDC